MNDIYIPTVDGSEKKLSLSEFYTILSFLESIDVSIAGMNMCYNNISDIFILSKELKDNGDAIKKQRILFKFNLNDNSLIVKNEIKGKLENDKTSLFQDFIKFVKNDNKLERYTISFYNVFDNNKTKNQENYGLYIANFLDFYYEKYGEMGNLVTAPIIKDSYEIDDKYKISDGVNNNKMIKKRY